jgi:hypothetical protein
MNIWNQYADLVKLVPASSASAGRDDGVSSVFFADTVYGESWPSGALAVTLYFSDAGNGSFSETDVIFNNTIKWNSYRGSAQYSGIIPVFDFHRVALHEFGHVLGLSHPDDRGQEVNALMNANISSLDHLTDDDIAGARSLYALKITSSLFPPSVRSGDDFSYQITANRPSTSYAAAGLPPGIQLNTATGVISGRCPTSGTFQVTVTVQIDGASATTSVRIIVTPRPITSSSFVQINLGDNFSYQIAADNSPTSFEATGLPAGVQLNATTGVLNGNPESSGTYTIKLVARSAQSEAAGNLTLSVQPPRITSSLSNSATNIGGNFSYQIMASNNPTSFSASGLPAGLHLDPATGLITGIAELSGQFLVTITAQGATGIATATLVITIQIPDSVTPPLKQISMSVTGSVLADPIRPRVYIQTSGGIAVVDTGSLSVTNTLPVAIFDGDMCISADGNTLWVTSRSTQSLKRIDLTSLSVLSDINVALSPHLIRAGADGRLYVTDYNQPNIYQVDPATGAILSQTDPRGTNVSNVSAIEISADRKTLYASNLYVGGAVSRYDISGSGAPVLIQRVEAITDPYSGRPLAINPNGTSFALLKRGSGGSVAPTQVRSSQDANQILGYFASAALPSEVVYDRQGTVAFQAMQGRSRIDVFQTFDSKLARTITLPSPAVPSYVNPSAITMAVDRTNSYLFVASDPGSGVGLYVFSLLSAPSPPPPPKTLLNVSTRLRTQLGDNALIGGFIVRGDTPKRMALRAIGPSLPLAGKLADPVLQLFDGSGALVAENDNWNAHRSDVLATGISPADEHEAEIAATLQPGSYTAVVSGVNNTTGIGLVEAYDLSPAPNSRLANISTRGKVEAGDSVMIGGFILGGDQPTSFVLRGIGPSLENFGVPGTLADPLLQVYDGNGLLVADNDDWRTYQEAMLIQSGLAPVNDRESAMLLQLQPGAYTVILRGKGNTAGVGLVEVYNLEAN